MDHNGEYTITEPNALVIAAAPEMLEALISWNMWVEETGEYEGDPTMIKVIEKATGKSWEEIKGLMNV